MVGGVSGLLIGNDVGDVTLAAFAIVAGSVDSIATTIFIIALPIDGGGGEAGLSEKFAGFGDAPEAPVIAECAIHAGTIAKDEIDEAGEVVGDGVEGVLVPLIGESLAASPFGEKGAGVGAAHDVEDEDAAGGERRADGAEVLSQGVTIFEDPPGEVTCGDHVHAPGSATRVEDIGADKGEAAGLVGGQVGDAVLFCPGDGFRVQVDGDSATKGAAFDP